MAELRAAALEKALGLSYHVVRKGYLYLVAPDGTSKKMKKAVFGLQKINVSQLMQKHGQYKIRVLPRP